MTHKLHLSIAFVIEENKTSYEKTRPYAWPADVGYEWIHDM